MKLLKVLLLFLVLIGAGYAQNGTPASAFYELTPQSAPAEPSNYWVCHSNGNYQTSYCTYYNFVCVNGNVSISVSVSMCNFQQYIVQNLNNEPAPIAFDMTYNVIDRNGTSDAQLEQVLQSLRNGYVDYPNDVLIEESNYTIRLKKGRYYLKEGKLLCIGQKLSPVDPISLFHAEPSPVLPPILSYVHCSNSFSGWMDDCYVIIGGCTWINYQGQSVQVSFSTRVCREDIATTRLANINNTPKEVSFDITSGISDISNTATQQELAILNNRIKNGYLIITEELSFSPGTGKRIILKPGNYPVIDGKLYTSTKLVSGPVIFGQ